MILSPLVFFISTVLCSASLASEQLGTFSFSDFLLQPTFNWNQTVGTQFSLYKSYVYLNWAHQNNLSIQIGLGPKNLINPSQFTNSVSPAPDLGIFEAVAQWDSGYGVVRGGLVPLHFGWEAKERESNRILPDTMFLESRYFGLRDYGVSYFISHNSFYTNVMIHNGEGGPDTDGILWYTTNFGWKNRAGFDVGLSGSVGKYNSGTDITRTRIGNLYAGINFYKTTFLIEGFIGETRGMSTRTQFADWHIDIGHSLGFLGVQFRYENLDPNIDILGDKKNRWIVGFNISNEQQTSTLYLWGIKNAEETNEINNDAIMLSWRVNSILL